MTSWRYLAAALVLVAVPALGGCGGVAPEDDEIFKRAQSELADARSNPEIRKHAASALTNADDTLERAREADDAEKVRDLSFTALQQVRLARELADSRQRERKLMDLLTKREAETTEQPAQAGPRETLSQPVPEERRVPRSGAAPPTVPEPAQPRRAPQYDRQPASPRAEASQPPPPVPSQSGPKNTSPPDIPEPPDARAQTDRQSRPEPSSRKAPPTAPRQEQEADETSVAALEEKIFGSVEQAEQHPVLDIGGFAEGRADFPPALEEKLGYIAQLLKADPSRRVSVNGYADDYRDLVKNLRLADARAGAVKEYLTENGVRPSRIWAIGIGDPREADPNSGAVPRGVRIVLRSPDSYSRAP